MRKKAKKSRESNVNLKIKGDRSSRRLKNALEKAKRKKMSN